MANKGYDFPELTFSMNLPYKLEMFWMVVTTWDVWINISGNRGVNAAQTAETQVYRVHRRGVIGRSTG